MGKAGSKTIGDGRVISKALVVMQRMSVSKIDGSPALLGANLGWIRLSFYQTQQREELGYIISVVHMV